MFEKKVLSFPKVFFVILYLITTWIPAQNLIPETLG